MFTLEDRGKEGVAASLTGVGGGSQDTLAAQLAGDPGLQVPKSMYWNLILRFLPCGPDWHAVAMVACRLASRAPLEARAESSGAGLSTESSVPVSQGSEVEKPLRSMKPPSAQSSSTRQGPQAMGSLAAGPDSHLWPGLAQWVGWRWPSWSLASWGWLFTFFSLGRAEGVCPCPATVGILGALLPSSGIVLPIPPAASPASVNMAAGCLKGGSPPSAPSAAKMVSRSFLDPREVWEQAGPR